MLSNAYMMWRNTRMTFKERLELCVYSSSLKNDTYDNVYAKNYNSVYSENDCIFEPKIIIVGTFTPIGGRANGFFYSSPKNKQMYFIDNELGKLKDELVNACVSDKKEKVDAILKRLKKIEIMFLDTVYCNKSVNESRADDNYIDFDTLDDKSFARYLKKEVRFICNSRNAFYALEKICEKSRSYPKDIVYVPQINFHTSDTEKFRQWSYAINKNNNVFEGTVPKRVPRK